MNASKINELIILHNNMCRVRGLPQQIKIGTRLTFEAIADKIEYVNRKPIRKRQPPKKLKWWALW